jgi:hypothetical protein
MRKQPYTYIKNSEMEKPQFLFKQKEDDKLDYTDAQIKEKQERELESHLRNVSKIQSSMGTRQ